MSYIFEHFSKSKQSMEHYDFERKSNIGRYLENLLTSNIQIRLARRAMLLGIDEGAIDDELKSGERLGQRIWAEINWSGEMKSGENEIRKPTNLKYPTTATRRAMTVGIVEGNVSPKMKNAIV